MNELKVEKVKTRMEKQVMERMRMLRRQGRGAGGHLELVGLVGALQFLE